MWILEGSLVPKLMEKLKNIENFYVSLKGKVEKAFQDIDETKKILKQVCVCTTFLSLS